MLSGSLRLRNFGISYPALALVTSPETLMAPQVEANAEPSASTYEAPVLSPEKAIEDSGQLDVLEAQAAPAPAPVPPSISASVVTIAPPVADTPETPLHGAMFLWSVAEGDLGTHRVNDQVMTTLSATYLGTKVSNYSVAAGTLPPELAFNTTRAILSGTLQQEGHYVFTIRAVAGDASSDATYSLTVE